jgi:pimeloyl-ACP methyl ester carboxylesterase
VIVLAHGFSLDMSTWSAVWPELARTFRVVTFDQRSHGGSGTAAHRDLSVRSIGRDLAAVLEAVSPGRPAVVAGHSMGGIAILALAEQRPELFGPQVGGAVFVGAAAANLVWGAMGSLTEFVRPRLGSLSSTAKRMDRLRHAVVRSPGDVAGIAARLTQFGPDVPHAIVDHVVGLAGRARSEVWNEGLAELMNVDMRHAIARVTVPALVVVGEHDRVTPPAAAIELASALPQGRLAVLEGAGHIPMLERPDELTAEIRSFATTTLVSRKRARRRSSGKEGVA